MTNIGRFITNVVALTVLYAMVLASLSPADLLIGAAISTGLVLAVKRGDGADRSVNGPSVLHRLIWAIPFGLRSAWLIITGAWNVALMVVHLRPITRVGFVAIPIGDRTVAGVATTALVDTLSPGSVFVEADWERGVMIFHVLGDEDPDTLRASYQHFYENYQRQVFP